MRKTWFFVPAALFGAASCLPASGLAADLSMCASNGGTATASSTAELTLTEYLQQVRAGHAGVRAAEDTIRAAELSVQEAESLFSPYLNANATRFDSQAESASVLSGDRTLVSSWSASVSKRWRTGTLTSVGYKGDWTKLYYPDLAANPAFAGLSSLLSTEAQYTSAPSVTVSQPLWKDFWANGAKATIAKVQASTRSLQALNRFKIDQILFSAEQSYVQLCLARATVLIQEESLQRNLRILDWAERRAAQNLADRVDALQTEAAVKQVQIGLAQAKEDLANAIRQFNTLRGQDGRPDAERLEGLRPPQGDVIRTGDRSDLQSARFDLNSRRAAVEEVTDRYRPDLSLFGTASLTGRDPSYGDAVSQSFSTRRPVTTVGIALSTSLDVPRIHNAIEGSRIAAAAGEQDLKQRTLDLERDWSALQRHWDSVRERLRIADELEKLQQEKAEREKVRFRNGRTTNFQVLRFEEDYAQSQLLKLRLLAEAQIVLAQARFYNHNGR